jgi:hypothetical protein
MERKNWKWRRRRRKGRRGNGVRRKKCETEE